MHDMSLANRTNKAVPTLEAHQSCNIFVTGTLLSNIALYIQDCMLTLRTDAHWGAIHISICRCMLVLEYQKQD